jgi:hypothetical protein
MTDDPKTPVRAGVPEGGPGLQTAPDVRRPDEHIRRPQLRVKLKEGRPAVERSARRAPEAAPEAPEPAPAAPAAVPEPAHAEEPAQAAPHPTPAPARQVPPPAGGDDPRFRYATYRTAPHDEPASRWRQLAARITRDGTREISTGFVLGVALILVILIGGVWVARLSNRVSMLEQRLVRLEQGPVTTADAGDVLP